MRFLLGASLGVISMMMTGCDTFSPGKADTNGAPNWVALRKKMVREQLLARGRDISNTAVLKAMGTVPRHEFVPEEVRHGAYWDSPLPIGYNQTITQPCLVASMSERLEPKPTDKVLEVGTGCGYHAAILSQVVAEVYSIEILEPLATQAKDTLGRLGYTNVIVKAGDGYEGWKEHAPFDGIIVTCAPDHVPQPLVDQLKEGGTMVIPVGELVGAQQMYVLKKKEGKVEEHAIYPVRFVPMTGDKGFKYLDKFKPKPAAPSK